MPTPTSIGVRAGSVVPISSLHAGSLNSPAISSINGVQRTRAGAGCNLDNVEGGGDEREGYSSQGAFHSGPEHAERASQQRLDYLEELEVGSGTGSGIYSSSSSITGGISTGRSGISSTGLASTSRSSASSINAAFTAAAAATTTTLEVDVHAATQAAAGGGEGEGGSGWGGAGEGLGRVRAASVSPPCSPARSDQLGSVSYRRPKGDRAVSGPRLMDVKLPIGEVPRA